MMGAVVLVCVFVIGLICLLLCLWCGVCCGCGDCLFVCCVCDLGLCW